MVRIELLEREVNELKADALPPPGAEYFEDVVKVLAVVKSKFASCRWWRVGNELMAVEVTDAQFSGLNRVRRADLIDKVLEGLDERAFNRVVECHARTPSEL